MKKSRFSEHQIITILKSGEAGRTAKDVCREHDISSATFYAWKSKFGGMEASGIKRMRDLEHENARLKHNVCGLKPGESGLEGCDRKKAWTFRQQGVHGIAHKSKHVSLQTNAA